jgi:O-antigen/teichoic acid export membrane protein
MTLVISWLWWLAPQQSLDAAASATLQGNQLMALAAWPVCYGLCKLVLSFLIQPGFRHRFSLDRQARLELLGFGGWVFVSTACMFLAAQADRLVVGRLSLDVLGVYHIATQMAAVPTMLMLTLASQLVFPLYSRALNAGHDLGAVYARVHPLFTGCAAVLVTGLVCTGSTVVRCLYPSRYQEAGWFVQLLPMAGWFTILQSTRDTILLAQGRTPALAAGQTVRLLSLPPLLLIGFDIGGLTGMILGLTGSEFLRYLVNVWLVREQRLSLLLNDIPLSLLIVVISLACAHLGPLLWDEAPRFARLALEGSSVVAAWAVVFMVWRSRRQLVFGALLRRFHTEEQQP